MEKDLLSIGDLTAAEILEIVELAKTQTSGIYSDILKEKQLVLIFEKPSLRTRASFEAGIRELGGGVTYFSAAENGRLGERESIPDYAHTLESYYSAIIARVFSHADLKQLAENTKIPVINALSDVEHPCQILADLVVISNHLKRLENFKLVFLGDGNNVAFSLALAAKILGFEFVLVGPKEYFLLDKNIQQTEDIAVALQNADVIYTDTWVSMGDEAEATARKKMFQPYQLNKKNLALAKPEAIVMHCLPAHRGQEITDEVIDSSQSVVFEQARSRLSAQKAVMIKLLGK